MKKSFWCRWFDHKWLPVYIHSIYYDISVRFIGCYCSRCFFGYNQLSDTIDKATRNIHNTCNEKYF